MKVWQWPNEQGWTVGPYDVEKVMRCGKTMLLVKSLYRIALVKSTDDPEKAVELTQRYGWPRQDMDSLGQDMRDQLIRSRIL